MDPAEREGAGAAWLPPADARLQGSGRRRRGLGQCRPAESVAHHQGAPLDSWLHVRVAATNFGSAFAWLMVARAVRRVALLNLSKTWHSARWCICRHPRFVMTVCQNPGQHTGRTDVRVSSHMWFNDVSMASGGVMWPRNLRVCSRRNYGAGRATALGIQA